MMTESLKHLRFVVQAVHWDSLNDHFSATFIAARMSGEIKYSPSKAGGGSHSCQYISLLSKLIIDLVAADFTTQYLTDL